MSLTYKLPVASTVVMGLQMEPADAVVGYLNSTNTYWWVASALLLKQRKWPFCKCCLNVIAAV